MKTCSSCRTEKPHSDFYKRKASRDGLAYKCKTCVNKYQKGRDPERLSQIKVDSYYRHQERNLEKKRKEYEADKEKILERNRLWRSKNKDKLVQARKLKYQANKGDYIAAANKRHADKLQRTPSWLTQEHLDQIKDIYAHARDCEVVTGDKYHVDHIVPLRGENVSGLHVPWNLQVLPAEVNLAKSNKTCHLNTV
jgi:hypothetical protein